MSDISGAVAKVDSALRTMNPNEPSGEWSAYDLMQACDLPEQDVREALVILREHTGGGRYVGGVSGHLYHL